jgi:hypothetical protein
MRVDMQLVKGLVQLPQLEFDSLFNRSMFAASDFCEQVNVTGAHKLQSTRNRIFAKATWGHRITSLIIVIIVVLGSCHGF